MLKFIRILLYSLLVSALFIINSVFAATITLPNTGQSTCYDSTGTAITCAGTGQDGDKQKGVAWPNPRFTDNGDGTVTDNLTGLFWLKNANCFGSQDWTVSLTSVNALSNGNCGLTDGSAAGQWRLPNRKELISLVDRSKSNPALPAGHPFFSVQGYPGYWSSSTYAGYSVYHWVVSIGYGTLSNTVGSYFAWPVRGGK